MNRISWKLLCALLFLAPTLPSFAADSIDEAAYHELKQLVLPYTYVLTKPAFVYSWYSETDEKN